MSINPHSPSQQMMASGNLLADAFRYGLESYGTNRNRHQWGKIHRCWLIDSGQYIRTSEQRPIGLMQFISEAGPELVNLHVVHPEDPYNPTAEELGINRGRTYPPPHHRGSAADVEHHWPGCGHE